MSLNQNDENSMYQSMLKKVEHNLTERKEKKPNRDMKKKIDGVIKNNFDGDGE